MRYQPGLESSLDLNFIFSKKQLSKQKIFSPIKSQAGKTLAMDFLQEKCFQSALNGVLMVHTMWLLIPSTQYLSTSVFTMQIEPVYNKKVQSEN